MKVTIFTLDTPKELMVYDIDVPVLVRLKEGLRAVKRYPKADTIGAAAVTAVVAGVGYLGLLVLRESQNVANIDQIIIEKATSLGMELPDGDDYMTIIQYK